MDIDDEHPRKQLWTAVFFGAMMLTFAILYLAHACQSPRYAIAPSAAGYCIKIDVRTGDIWSVVHDDTGAVNLQPGFVSVPTVTSTR
jgi:hypothetical protein